MRLAGVQEYFFFVVLTRLFYRVLVTSSSTGEVLGG
jgi:hypothetical protein